MDSAKMQRRRAVLGRKSFSMPPVNPFIHSLELNTLQKIQIFFMSFTIAPLRLVLTILLLILAWCIAFIFTIGLSMEEKRPVSSWRRLSIILIKPIMRSVFFVLGIVWIEQKGSPAMLEEADTFVIAPHSAFYDGIPCVQTAGSVVAKSELMSMPLIGTLLRTLQPVLVDRHDPESRQKTIEEIERRTRSKDNWPQMIIFPEGTCTNRKALITFKAGAFIPGLPIQPVLLRYPNVLDTVTWTMNGPGTLKLLWLSLCQFYIRMQVEFLPVYHPSREEIDDPKLYADNVRRLMAEKLGVPCTDHTFEDCRLMYRAESHSLPMEAGLVEFSKLNRNLGIDIDEMKDLLDEFASISRSCKDGLMGIKEFAEHLKLPVTKQLESLFNMYDRNGSGLIDFREYVIGMSLVSHSAVTEKTMRLAFKVFDQDGDGMVSRNELDHVLKSVFGPEFDATEIYNRLDEKQQGKIGYDEFYNFAKKRPEYAKLFVSYAELEQDDIPFIHKISNASSRHDSSTGSIDEGSTSKTDESVSHSKTD